MEDNDRKDDDVQPLDDAEESFLENDVVREKPMAQSFWDKYGVALIFGLVMALLVVLVGVSVFISTSKVAPHFSK